METIVLILYLLVLSFFDLKEKKVPVLLLALGIMTSVVFALYLCFIGTNHWIHSVMGVLPGILLLVVAWVTEKAGYADGIVMLMIGVLAGGREGFFVLCISLLLLSFLSIVLLALKKVGKKTRLPYIPFITLAYLLRVMMAGSGGIA